MLVSTRIDSASRGGPLRRAAFDSRAAADGRRIQSVDRALDLMEILADAPQDLQLSEIAARSGLNASTCHHLLATLVQRGCVARAPRGRGYRLGSWLAEMTERRVGQSNLADIAMPALRQLGADTQECVQIAALQGHALVTLARLESRRGERLDADPADKIDAAHATAIGKAILAWLPEAEIARVIAETGLRRFTDSTHATLSDLAEELRHVRRNGFAVDNQEFQVGVVCIGAAIRERSGAVVGSVGCSMPRERAVGESFERATQAVRACAALVSERFGNFGDLRRPARAER